VYAGKHAAKTDGTRGQDMRHVEMEVRGEDQGEKAAQPYAWAVYGSAHAMRV